MSHKKQKNAKCRLESDSTNKQNQTSDNNETNQEKVVKKTPYQLGKEEEEAAGIKKNTEIIKINGHDRIPDELDIEERIIGEVKNVKYQGYTSQLRDYIQYAKEKGYKFKFYIRDGGVMSKPLQNALNSINADIQYFKTGA